MTTMYMDFSVTSTLLAYKTGRQKKRHVSWFHVVD